MTGIRIRFLTRRRLRCLGALAGFVAVFFAQAALALAACNLQSGAPSRAVALSMSAAAERDSPCHDQAPASDTLCLAHCQANDQSLDKQQVKLPVLQVHLLPRLELPVARRPAVPPRRAPAPSASPPARILFQSLLI